MAEEPIKYYDDVHDMPVKCKCGAMAFFMEDVVTHNKQEYLEFMCDACGYKFRVLYPAMFREFDEG